LPPAPRVVYLATPGLGRRRIFDQRLRRHNRCSQFSCRSAGKLRVHRRDAEHAERTCRTSIVDLRNRSLPAQFRPSFVTRASRPCCRCVWMDDLDNSSLPNPFGSLAWAGRPCYEDRDREFTAALYPGCRPIHSSPRSQRLRADASAPLASVTAAGGWFGR
jgi:hypothetical protein